MPSKSTEQYILWLDQVERERDMLRAEREVWANIAQERNDLRAEVERLKAALDTVTELLGVAYDDGYKLKAENERLRARLCYVNPDGSHVRGCTQHEAQHPAQWCESLAQHME